MCVSSTAKSLLCVCTYVGHVAHDCRGAEAGWYNRYCLDEKRAYSCPGKDERQYLAILDKKKLQQGLRLQRRQQNRLCYWLLLLVPLGFRSVVGGIFARVTLLGFATAASPILAVRGLLLLLLFPSSLLRGRFFRFFVCLLLPASKSFRKIPLRSFERLCFAGMGFKNSCKCPTLRSPGE